MRTDRCDPAVFEDDDFVGLLGGRDAVRDDNRCQVLVILFQGFPDFQIRARVDGTQRVVEDQNRLIQQQHPRDRDPLFLAARQGHALFPDEGVIPFLEVLDVLMDRGNFRGLVYLFRIGIPGGDFDVLENARRVQERILQDDADILPYPRFFDVLEFDAVDRDAAIIIIEQAYEDAGNRRFSAAGLPDEGHRFARLD